jgi:histidyl-tRNA synthetase
MGLERLVAILEEVDADAGRRAADLYLVLVGDAAQSEGLALAESLRDALPGRVIQCNCGGGGFKAQFKRADRSGAHLALVLGDDELAAGHVVIKPMRSDAEQQIVTRDELIDELQNRLPDRERSQQVGGSDGGILQ